MIVTTLLPVAYTVGGVVLLSIAVYFSIRFFAYKRSFPLPRRFDFLWLTLTVLSLFLAAASLPPLEGSFKAGFITWIDFAVFLLACYLLIFVLDQFLVEHFLVNTLKIYISPPLRKVMVLAVFLLSVLVGIQQIFNITPWAVYTPTAALSLGIGYALKDAFQTFFSGVALSRIIRIGDWISLNEREGEVVDINWARTVLRTKNGDHVFVPNGELQKGIFTNFSYKNRLHRCMLEIGAAYAVPPQKVKRVLLECAQNVAGVLPHPLPDAYLKSYGDFAVNYVLTFWVNDYSQWREISSEVSTRIWYAFKREGIEIPFPIRTVQMAARGKEEAQSVDAETLLGEIDLLRALSAEEKAFVLERLKRQSYLKGEVVVRQGEPGDSFYIVMRGTVEVLRQAGAGRSSVVGRLEAGQFFGELSLLTGEPRSATVRAARDSELLRLEKEDFREILSQRPDLSETLAEIVLSRQTALKEHASREESAAAQAEDSGRKSSMSHKIREFFNLKTRV